MLDVLRAGMDEHGIPNIYISEGLWPPEDGTVPGADVALMAHVGYDIEDFGSFLDAAEAAASRLCVVVMRSAHTANAGWALWQDIHGEPRVPLPMLSELLVLLLARGVTPSVTLTERVTWGYESPKLLLGALRRQLWVAPGSDKDQRLRALVEERAVERHGSWSTEWQPMLDGIVTWEPRH